MHAQPLGKKPELIASLVLLLAAALCITVYWPGLRGSFLVDDFDSLQAVNNFGGVTDIQTFLSFIFGNSSGALGRPVAMASFLINDQYWPGDPWFFKYTNLLLHVIIGLVLFVFVNRLLTGISASAQSSYTVALFVSAIWLLHPLNVSTTLYVVQRMTQLMALFSLLAVLCFVLGRPRVQSAPRAAALAMFGGLTVFGALAVLSKENGVLTLLYILIIEATFYRQWVKPKWFKITFALFVLAPLAVLILHFTLTWTSTVAGYAYRDFSLSERLLTEARILIQYLRLIFLPGIGGTGLVHDDIPLSNGLLSPVSTLLSLAAIAAVLGLAFCRRKRQPVLAFGVFWFFAGHLLESTHIPLELYFEHRNYLPMVGPVLILCYYAVEQSAKIEIPLVRKLLPKLPVLFIVFAGALTYQSSKTWANPFELFRVWAIEHPASLRAQRMYAQSLMPFGRYDETIAILQNTYKRYPYDISLPIAMFTTACESKQIPAYSLQDLAQLTQSARFTDGVLPTAKNLLKTIENGACDGVFAADVHQFLTAIEYLFGLRSKVKAELLYLHAKIYMAERNLPGSMALLDKALEHQKATFIPVLQARLLASAGLYEDALKYIAVAKTIDGKQRKLLPSQMAAIETLESEIQQLRHAN